MPLTNCCHSEFLRPASCSLMEYVKDAVRLVASREMHVCATFARRFYWSDLNLWPEDLAPGSVVLLSGKVWCADADRSPHATSSWRHNLGPQIRQHEWLNGFAEAAAVKGCVCV